MSEKLSLAPRDDNDARALSGGVSEKPGLQTTHNGKSCSASGFL